MQHAAGCAFFGSLDPFPFQTNEPVRRWFLSRHMRPALGKGMCCFMLLYSWIYSHHYPRQEEPPRCVKAPAQHSSHGFTAAARTRTGFNGAWGLIFPLSVTDSPSKTLSIVTEKITTQ